MFIVYMYVMYSSQILFWLINEINNLPAVMESAVEIPPATLRLPLYL